MGGQVKRRFLVALAALLVGAAIGIARQWPTSTPLPFERVSIVDAAALSRALFDSKLSRFPIIAVFDKRGALVGVEAEWNTQSVNDIEAMLERQGDGRTIDQVLDGSRLAGKAKRGTRQPTVLILSLAGCAPCQQMEAAVSLKPRWVSTSDLVLLRAEGQPLQ